MGATLETDKQGRRRLWFWVDGKRRSVRLGRMRQRDAQQFQKQIDSVLAARETGQTLDGDARRWLARLTDDAYEKLAAVGLVEPRRSARLGEFLESYVASRLPDTKHSTRLVYGHTKRCLLAFFGESKPLAAVTRGDAERFRRWLQSPKIEDDPESGQGLAENTCRRRIGIARQFFNAAIKDGLVDAGMNPFTGIRVGLRREEGRFHFVTIAEVEKVLAACPDSEWRLMVALARWGGLRVPSEAVELKLTDVNWAENRITIRSPKTAHHDGKGVRVIPLWPELRKPLLDAHERVPDGGEYFIPRYRGHSANLRTQFVRIIQDAGLKVWPKPWVNCRATRATELSQTHPAHVVAAWLGHSEAVCRKHYLTVTDADFDRAIGGVGGGAEMVQHEPAGAGNDRSDETEPDQKTPFSGDNRPLPVTADSSNRGDWAILDLNQ